MTNTSCRSRGVEVGARTCAVRFSVFCIVLGGFFSQNWEITLTTYLRVDKRNSNEDVPVCTDSCMWKAGIDGSWVQDFDFARNHGQYDIPWVVPQAAHIPSEDAQFPWRTSWKWVDQECSVDVMTYDGICHVLKRLDIRHLLFYGDSLSMSHFRSFVNQMNSTNFDKAEGNNGVLTCQVREDKVPYTVRILYDRDKGGNGYSPSSPRGIYRMENSTKMFIQEANMDRMLAVFNIGAHYHNWTHYREDMDAMVGMLEEANRTQDIYIFRSTSPGHAGCLPRSKKFDWKLGTRFYPLTNFSEYQSGHSYDWDQFGGYNNYTKHFLLKRNRLGLRPVMHYLNIYNMTALRSDAHYGPYDCLHFLAPGPVDWWNHLLYTYLKRMADRHKENCRMI